ncbi:histone H3-K9 methyltransferase [Parasponia andersonii]|uniref:Histone H3-K9 methyltransferase n=1 Tax=Parasponia andersonii TaxID=3476 RepID=A0A2P5C1A2_PARAD|nr:histone H3-K9 methyltransferase [Parasponia andersonii]
MSRGNLALKNNMEQSLPIRVVRGHKCLASYSSKVYAYDGLYKVVQYWAEKGVAGFTVFKYRLKRLPGQPQLVTNRVHFIRRKGHKAQSVLPGLVCEDISHGQENIPIPVTNVIDDPPLAPEGFTYVKSIQVASNIKIPPNGPGCNCEEGCTNPKTCSCAERNGSDFPYVSRNGGRLIEAMGVVFECGPNCGCGPKCINRTSTREMKHRLEVYRTLEKGWAVRSWDYILPGSPVCEYVGVLKRSDELDNVSGNDYIFEIDCLETIDGIGGRERRMHNVSLPRSHANRKDAKKSESVPEFCIDAGSSGNVARFINHSCEPNLLFQCILNSHHDPRLARVVLFAADNIAPLQELTYDYGYALDSVVGPDGKTKKLPCYCGAACCRKRLY